LAGHHRRRSEIAPGAPTDPAAKAGKHPGVSCSPHLNTREFAMSLETILLIIAVLTLIGAEEILK
jgi:hypothetical protein